MKPLTDIQISDELNEVMDRYDEVDDVWSDASIEAKAQLVVAVQLERLIRILTEKR